MAEEQDSAEKPFEPTQRKLEEARKQGEIVRSSDLNTAVTYGGLLLGAVLFGQALGQDIGTLSRVILGQADDLAVQMLGPGGQALAGGMVLNAFAALVAVLGVPAALLIAALFAQRAILFTPTKLTPKLSRLSIVKNAKQKFGANGLFEFAKSAAKLLIHSTILALFLWNRSDLILGAIYAEDGQILAILGRLSLEFLALATAVALAIGVIDYFWQSAQHHKKNMMSQKELRDETKQSEGDPHMKQQRRQRGVGLAMNRMLADVPEANVVVVNPTHYAVALKWDRGAGEVPVCVAKGVDEIARAIREAAAEAGVPVFRDPPTARALHAAIEIGAPIEPDHFRAVAAAIRFADAMRARARAKRR